MGAGARLHRRERRTLDFATHSMIPSRAHTRPHVERVTGVIPRAVGIGGYTPFSYSFLEIQTARPTILISSAAHSWPSVESIGSFGPSGADRAQVPPAATAAALDPCAAPELPTRPAPPPGRSGGKPAFSLPPPPSLRPRRSPQPVPSGLGLRQTRPELLPEGS